MVIQHGDAAVAVVEVGGGLRSYQFGGVDVLDGYAVGEMCRSGRGQLLVPWPNRLADGRYQVDGEALQLALSEPEHHNAIHGLARFANWVVVDEGPGRAVMAHRLHPQPGYPFLVDLSAEYHLDDQGLAVTMSATNRGTRPCPWAAGAHPYLRLATASGGELVDDLLLTVPAATWLETDSRGIPTGRQPVAGSPLDFRSPRLIGQARLDTAFTDLTRGPDGRAQISLADPGSPRKVWLWMDEAFPYLMIFTGDTVAAERRRHGLGVEPMTAAPNAFRSGDGLRTLGPGQTARSTWGISLAGWDS